MNTLKSFLKLCVDLYKYSKLTQKIFYNKFYVYHTFYSQLHTYTRRRIFTHHTYMLISKRFKVFWFFFIIFRLFFHIKYLLALFVWRIIVITERCSHHIIVNCVIFVVSLNFFFSNKITFFLGLISMISFFPYFDVNSYTHG